MGIMPTSNTGRQIFAAASASLIMLSCGYHNTFPADSIEHHTNDERRNFHGFLVLIMVISGAALSILLVDRLGRKSTLLLMTIPLIGFCGIMAAASKNAAWSAFARLVSALIMGIAVTVTPMYIGEIAEAKIRGGLFVVMPVMLHVGEFITLIIGTWTNRLTVLLMGTIFSILFAVALYRSPESPYYHAMKKNLAETYRSVAWLRGTSDVNHEVEEICHSVAHDEKRGCCTKVFAVRDHRKAFLINIGLLTCHLFAFLPLSIFYTVPDYSDHSSVISDIARSLIQLVISICIALLTDRVGRKPLLLSSAFFCWVFLIARLALTFPPVYSFLLSGSTVAILKPVVLMGYLISYSVGFDTLATYMGGELFPCRVMASALGLSVIYRYVTTLLFSTLLTWIGFQHGFLVILLTCAVGSTISPIFIRYIVPEPNGQPLPNFNISQESPYTVVEL